MVAEPLAGLVQGEVLFHDTRAQGHGEHCGFYAQCVVGIARRDPVLRQTENGAQPGLVIRCWVGRNAVQQRQAVRNIGSLPNTPGLFQEGDALGQLRLVAQTGGKQHGFARGRHSLDEREERVVRRGDLEGGHQRDQEPDRIQIKGRGKEKHPSLACCLRKIGELVVA